MIGSSPARTTSTSWTGPRRLCSRKQASLTPNLQEELARRLQDAHGFAVTTDPALLMRGTFWRLDRRGRRLLVAESAAPESRLFWMAHLVGQLEHRRMIDAEVHFGRFTTAEARALARVALGNYFAGALMFPYARFLEAAEGMRYDIERLQSRFGAGFEQVCHRAEHAPAARTARHPVLLRQDRYRRERAEAQQRDEVPILAPRRALPALERLPHVREPWAGARPARPHARRNCVPQHRADGHPRRRLPWGAPAGRRGRAGVRGRARRADCLRVRPGSIEWRCRNADRTRMPRLRKNRVPSSCRTASGSGAGLRQ